MIILEWKCDICKEIRPDAKISVRTHDRSKDVGLPEGTLQENVKYCNDKKECEEGAESFSFIKNKKGENGKDS